MRAETPPVTESVSAHRTSRTAREEREERQEHCPETDGEMRRSVCRYEHRIASDWFEAMSLGVLVLLLCRPVLLPASNKSCEQSVLRGLVRSCEPESPRDKKLGAQKIETRARSLEPVSPHSLSHHTLQALLTEPPIYPFSTPWPASCNYAVRAVKYSSFLR